jgi:membrane protein DedA with SNARE-associated domain
MDHINYLTVTLLMTIESSFIPFPSEIVIPPAAYKAAEGKMNMLVFSVPQHLERSLVHYLITSLRSLLVERLSTNLPIHALHV